MYLEQLPSGFTGCRLLPTLSAIIASSAVHPDAGFWVPSSIATFVLTTSRNEEDFLEALGLFEVLYDLSVTLSRRFNPTGIAYANCGIVGEKLPVSLRHRLFSAHPTRIRTTCACHSTTCLWI
jgi:hypothetical protein